METPVDDNQELSPFSIPPIVMEKVTREEYIKLLRDRVNKSYMPTSSNKVEFNRKPYYIPKLESYLDANEELPEGSGYYVEVEMLGTVKKNVPVWAYLDFVTVQVITNLSTETTFARRDGKKMPWYRWGVNSIAIDRNILMDKIDTYL